MSQIPKDDFRVIINGVDITAYLVEAQLDLRSNVHVVHSMTGESAAYRAGPDTADLYLHLHGALTDLGVQPEPIEGPTLPEGSTPIEGPKRKLPPPTEE